VGKDAMLQRASADGMVAVMRDLQSEVSSKGDERTQVSIPVKGAWGRGKMLERARADGMVAVMRDSQSEVSSTGEGRRRGSIPTSEGAGEGRGCWSEREQMGW
jgi:hypothetical protein